MTKKSSKKAVLPPGPVMVDVAGFTLTKEEKRLRHPLVGGVILFARNFESRAQLTRLTRQIHKARKEPLLILVDHEGGRVQRFREDGFTPLPPMRALGELWDRDPLNAMRLATEAGYVLAAELCACGVDMSFTPVLDLDYGVSKVIGNRAFHADPRVVAMLSRALIQGLSQAGMSACGKHFPATVMCRPIRTTRFRSTCARWPTSCATTPRPMPGWATPCCPRSCRRTSSIPRSTSIRRLLPALGAGHPAQAPGLRRGGVLRRPDHGRRLGGRRHPGPRQRGAGRGLRHGAGVQPADLADELLSRLSFKHPPESVERIRRLMPRFDAPDWDTLQAESRYQNARRLQSQIVPG